MRRIWVSFLVFGMSGCATIQNGGPTVSILVDLDPASTDRTVIVETTTADQQGRLYLADWVSGNILRVDKAVHVSNIDTPRRDNLDANGKTALDGIGASIARITP